MSKRERFADTRNHEILEIATGDGDDGIMMCPLVKQLIIRIPPS